tara:strand:- start:1129 stop:3423 length:2295 start_codon:yes stop_codon:yes gene_type:complete
VNLIRAVSLSALFFVFTLNAGYIYEANQSLIDLKTNYIATSYNLNSGDDQVSSAFNLDFTFTFYGEDFTSARMATNGCLHFKTSGAYCNDYTPDPLTGQHTYTLYPFWTDLIRDNGSSVLARNFTDKTVFGWYNLREYNRGNTDNSFEVILWKSDDSFEFRYGGLNIINHDVLIGEQGSSSESYTYLYHDECSTGTTNVAGTCVNTNWNSTSFNTLLENGGSLYGVGSGNGLDCSNPLNDTACTGYQAAFLNQQCDLDGLYSTQCPNYWDDLFDYECALDSQYSPACAGYMVETFVENTYYEEDMYGYESYEDDQYGYYDPFQEEDYYFEEDSVYITELQGIDEFQEELYFEETLFFEEEYFDPFIEEFDLLPEEELIPLSYIEEELYIEQIYEEIVLREEIFVLNYDLPILDDVLLNHFEHEELIEDYFEEETIEYLEFETIEDLEEWIEQEETEEILEELAVLSDDEDGDLEDSETVEEEIQDRNEDIELVVAESEEKKDNKRAEQLNVVANSILAASNSVSGTTAGTSAQATGMSASSGGSFSTTSASQTSAVSSSVSGGTISISNSPSISAQVASSAAQTQQVLSMSVSNTNIGNNNTAVGGTTTVASNTSTNTGGSGNTSGTQNVAVGQNTDTSGSQNTAVGSMELEIDTAMSEMSASEADLIADQIVAQNIEDQQEELEQQQQETGEYGDEAQLIAYMGFVPGFSAYSQVEVPQPSVWYEPELIYTNVNIPDNNSAFSGLYGESLTGMNDLMNMQPNL